LNVRSVEVLQKLRNLDMKDIIIIFVPKNVLLNGTVLMQIQLVIFVEKPFTLSLTEWKEAKIIFAVTSVKAIITRKMICLRVKTIQTGKAAQTQQKSLEKVIITKNGVRKYYKEMITPVKIAMLEAENFKSII